MSNSGSLKFGEPDPYRLLRSYSKEAKIKSKAYGYSEGYYRWLYKILNHPTIIISAGLSVMSGLNVNEYVFI